MRFSFSPSAMCVSSSTIRMRLFSVRFIFPPFRDLFRKDQRQYGSFPHTFAVGDHLPVMKPGDLLNEIEADPAPPHGGRTIVSGLIELAEDPFALCFGDADSIIPEVDQQ